MHFHRKKKVEQIALGSILSFFVLLTAAIHSPRLQSTHLPFRFKLAFSLYGTTRMPAFCRTFDTNGLCRASPTEPPAEKAQGLSGVPPPWRPYIAGKKKPRERQICRSASNFTVKHNRSFDSCSNIYIQKHCVTFCCLLNPIFGSLIHHMPAISVKEMKTQIFEAFLVSKLN